MRAIIPLIAAALLFVGCEKSEDKAQKAASEQGAKVATSASIKGRKKMKTTRVQISKNEFIKIRYARRKKVSNLDLKIIT